MEQRCWRCGGQGYVLRPTLTVMRTYDYEQDRPIAVEKSELEKVPCTCSVPPPEIDEDHLVVCVYEILQMRDTAAHDLLPARLRQANTKCGGWVSGKLMALFLLSNPHHEENLISALEGMPVDDTRGAESLTAYLISKLPVGYRDAFRRNLHGDPRWKLSIRPTTSLIG